MKITETSIPGLVILEPQVFGDSRGYFFESYNKGEFHRVTGLDVDFVQDNESLSSRGVVRGLHYQRGKDAQAKLIRVVSGEVLDVALDLRLGSPTFGKTFSVVLSAENRRQVFLPRGLAHGFSVLSEKAQFLYKCDNHYAPCSAGGIYPFDPELEIDWRIPLDQAILSEKDKNGKLFSKLTINDYYEGD